MNWVTIAWSMGASVCLTLAVIHFYIWVRDRQRYAYLLFSLSALGAALTGWFELLTLRAESVAQYEWAMHWGQIPEALLAVSMGWFIRVYFQAGHRWILITITVLWTLLLLLNFSSPHAIEFRQITGLYNGTTFWGERFAQAEGEPNPWRFLGDAASALMVLFVVDASVALWRRGSRYRAVIAGGTAIFLLLSGIHNLLADAGLVHTPYMNSLCFLTIVLAMSHELGSDVLRAEQLARRLQASEAARRESEERFRILADTAPVLVWMSGTDMLCNFFNKQWLEFTGRTIEQELGNGWSEGVHTEDLAGCVETYVSSFKACQPFAMEYRLRRVDGEYRWVLDHGVPRYTPEGQFAGYIGSCIDITERRLAEERFRLVTEAAPNAVIIINAEGRIELANAQVKAVFGYDRDELVGHPVEILVPERFRSQHPHHRNFYFADPTTRAMGAGRELFGRRKDGSEVPVEIGLNPIRSSEGLFVLASIIDITQRRQAELEAARQRTELARLLRVALLGELSGSLSHELSQPLGAIHTNAEAAEILIKKQAPDIEEIRAIISDIRQDGWRAGEVIQRMRSLLEKGEAKLEPLDINEVVESVLKLVRSDLAHHNVAVDAQLAPHLPAVNGDDVQLQQVLLNLVVNGCDAMAGVEPIERRLLVRTELADGREVLVSVTDQGHGIPPEKIDHIFEPFFTTKTHGMGLGLAVCCTIISAHGGMLWATNNARRGATVQFRLPTNGCATERASLQQPAL